VNDDSIFIKLRLVDHKRVGAGEYVGVHFTVMCELGSHHLATIGSVGIHTRLLQQVAYVSLFGLNSGHYTPAGV
jgi:hypothetical protein